ncbi:MAG: hypothetical protein ABL982_23515, partial [Vicinamibacterales bacterium]
PRGERRTPGGELLLSVSMGLLGTLLISSMMTGVPEWKREARADFAADPAFQGDGGVQVYFEVMTPTEALAFQSLDLNGLGKAEHVAVVRLSYTLDKDASFFTQERVTDLAYVQAIAPDMKVSQQPDGGFVVGRTPANRFSVRFFTDTSGFPAQTKLAHEPGPPSSLVIQQNTGFSRVMGWRTAEASITWTLHHALAPGRTRVTVLTVSYLHNLPPFFLGGEARMFRETMENAQALISRLRAYRP